MKGPQVTWLSHTCFDWYTHVVVSDSTRTKAEEPLKSMEMEGPKTVPSLPAFTRKQQGDACLQEFHL